MGRSFQQSLQLNQRGHIDARRADAHPGADLAIQHPAGHRDNHTGRPLYLEKLVCCSMLDATNQNHQAEIGGIPVMDLQLLPDMGRMNGEWPWAGRHGSSPAPTGRRARRRHGDADHHGKVNDVDPQAWLADVLARIAGLPQSRLAELLPWNRQTGRADHRQAA